jgi:hypothetical protein
MPRPGRPADVSVSKHFTYHRLVGKAICWTAVCKLCEKYNAAKSLDQERTHLLTKCPKYEEWQKANNKQIQTRITQYANSQIDLARKARIDQKLAFAMYKTGQAFTAFEDSA